MFVREPKPPARFRELHGRDFPLILGAVAISSSASTARQGDGRLWVIALGMSLLLNAIILIIVGVVSISPFFLRKAPPLAATPPPPAEQIITIFPETAAVQAPADVPVAAPRFARTSPDQAASPPENPAFIGERDTLATSDRRAETAAPPLPSQAGIEPRDAEDLETTESRYQDGELASDPSPSPPAPAAPPSPAMESAVAAASGEKVETPGSGETLSAPPPRERLLDGPNPVDIPVLPDEPEIAQAKPAPVERPREGEKAADPADATKPTPPAAKPADPAFSGNQRKTAIRGSISRTGRSALDVADSPLGRYQALVSRAVELEWQRNCMRHRDFITPGYLTVRFFIEASGRVRSVQFVGEMETGEVQKGFTLNSIRNAEIPAMPPALRKDFAGEPLELIFNFYF